MKKYSMGRIYWAVLPILTVVILFTGCSEKAKQGRAEQPAVEERATETEQAVEPEVTEISNEVSFTTAVAPIFAAKCNACHHPDNAVKVDLTRPFHPELGLINRPNSWTKSSRPVLVVPGDPDACALVWKVKGEPLPPNLGQPMPLHYERLTPEEQQVLRDWIAEGAENN